MTLTQTARYPKGLPFIIATEVAERFSFYGMSGILPIFLVNAFFNPASTPGLQNVAEAQANEQTHLFVTLAYFMPLIGGIMADWFFGKYKVILYISLLYCLGHFILAMYDTDLKIFRIGLILIAVGAGGLKSNVSSNLGDQFTRQNDHLLSKAFGWFYFGINCGSVLATLAIPWVYKYYGAKLAFGIPGILMALATLIFFLGRKSYRMMPPSGIRKESFLIVVLFMVSELFIKSNKSVLERTKDRFSVMAVDGVLAVWRLTAVLIFIPIFWAMWYQSLSEWVLQANKLDLNFFGWHLIPAQVQTFNPLFILVGIPLFTYVIYPGLEKMGVRCTSLRKIGAGLFLCLVSFIIIALVQTSIDKGQHPTVLLQMLAYLLITFSEVLISVTFLEYAYTQSPPKLKSTMTAIWWLTLAAGNLFTAMVNHSIAKGGMFGRFTGAAYYWLFCAILAVFLAAYLVVSPHIKEKTYLAEQ